MELKNKRVLVVGLGCEKLAPERLLPKGQETGTLRLQDEAYVGFGAMIDGIMEKVEERLKILNRRKRETVPASELVRLYKEYEDRLFDRNVRLFLGAKKGSVNAGIAETLSLREARDIGQADLMWCSAPQFRYYLCLGNTAEAE